MIERKKGFVTTKDGVKLEYIDQGKGPVIVMIPAGTGGPPEQNSVFYDGLPDNIRAISIGTRGTGLSDRPSWGYSLARHASDIHDAIEALDLHDVTLFGYSGGADVMYQYWEIFGKGRVTKLVNGDKEPACSFDITWPKEKILNSGAVGTFDDWHALMQLYRSPAMAQLAAKPEDAERQYKIGLTHGVTNWMDIGPSITVPMLIVSATEYMGPDTGYGRSMRYLHNETPGSILKVIEGDHGSAGASQEFKETLVEFVLHGDEGFEERRMQDIQNYKPFAEPFDVDAPIITLWSKIKAGMEQMCGTTVEEMLKDAFR